MQKKLKVRQKNNSGYLVKRIVRLSSELLNSLLHDLGRFDSTWLHFFFYFALFFFSLAWVRSTNVPMGYIQLTTIYVYISQTYFSSFISHSVILFHFISFYLFIFFSFIIPHSLRYYLLTWDIDEEKKISCIWLCRIYYTWYTRTLYTEVAIPSAKRFPL